MENIVSLPNMPGYVSIKEAAEMLKLKPNRVYEYVTEGRLKGEWAADVIMIPIEEVKNFRRRATGRPRKNDPKWHKSPPEHLSHSLLIFAPVKPGQQHVLRRKMEEIRQKQTHIFPGSVARYIIESDPPEEAQILLIWRNTDLTDKTVYDEAINVFRQELADVLDWDTAQYKSGKLLLHT